MTLHEDKEKFLNRLVLRLPAHIQILFMERVLKSVEESLLEEKADQVLFSEKEGYLRARRQGKPSAVVPTAQLEMFYLPGVHQPPPTISELLRRDRRAHRSHIQGRYPHVGKYRTRARVLQLLKVRRTSR